MVILFGQPDTVWQFFWENGGALLRSRLLLHPLHSYQGPWPAKLTNAYNGVHALCQDLHIRTYLNHRKYGSAVRPGPNKLVFDMVTAMRDIYRTDKTTKPKAYMALGPGLKTYNVFTATDNKLHRQRRQLVGQVLTDKSMRAFELVMMREVDVLLSNILHAAEQRIDLDISKEARRLGLTSPGSWPSDTI
ncbi:hypothetical protein GGR57DRAFT_509223 [Xylariaceae sp. FL1272]|nr:hypothetical protein GGR57DRAFT_509223 [Xylariaceae sp. FL1272]